MEEALRQEVRRRMQEIAQEELEEVKIKIINRIGQELDSLALGILDRYDVQRDARGLYITVSKPVVVKE
jgi:hypothetical protein